MISGYETQTLMYVALALLGTGVIAGLAAGMLGIGGGIVIVPILYAILAKLNVDSAVRMQVSVATSLSVIVVTGILAVRMQRRAGYISASLIVRWGTAAFLGSIIGSVVGSYADGDFLRMFFSIFCIAIALRMLFSKEHGDAADASIKAPKVVQVGIAFLIGVFSTMVGIGGGVLSVPSMVFFGVEIHYATATSSALSMLIAIPGALGFIVTGWGNEALPPFSLGYMNWAMFLIISATALVSTPMGVKWAHRVDRRVLRRIFAAVIILSSLKMIF